MQQMVICKSCGFIMAQAKLHEVCPACGVPAKLFIPFEERISPGRKRILALDIHPVLVHFTQAYTATILLLSVLALVVKAGWVERITTVVIVLGYALPFSVVAAFVAGMFDGKIRFRKVKTPLLVKKMILGSVFFALTCGVFVSVLCNPLPLAIIAVLSALAMVCASILGVWGVSLLNSRFPG
ncbi:MAG: hypothetical protein WCO42_04705 [bacterium]